LSGVSSLLDLDNHFLFFTGFDDDDDDDSGAVEACWAHNLLKISNKQSTGLSQRRGQKYPTERSFIEG
jgi:hypothetical protein